MRTQVQSLAWLCGLRIQHCCKLQCRSQTGFDLALLWLWCWLAAVALIQPLGWELPYAMGVALKKRKKKKEKKRKEKKRERERKADEIIENVHF